MLGSYLLSVGKLPTKLVEPIMCIFKSKTKTQDQLKKMKFLESRQLIDRLRQA